MSTQDTPRRKTDEEILERIAICQAVIDSEGNDGRAGSGDRNEAIGQKGALLWVLGERE